MHVTFLHHPSAVPPSLLPDALPHPLTALRGGTEAPQKKKVQIQALELFPSELRTGDGSWFDGFDGKSR